MKMCGKNKKKVACVIFILTLVESVVVKRATDLLWNTALH